MIGCNPQERLDPQILNLNVSLSLPPLKKGGQGGFTDQLADTVDYGELARLLTQTASKTEYFLIETLAQVLAEACLKFDPRIQKIKLKLEKTGCIENAQSAGVILIEGT